VKVIEVECLEYSDQDEDCCLEGDMNGHRGVTRGTIGDNKLY